MASCSGLFSLRLRDHPWRCGDKHGRPWKTGVRRALSSVHGITVACLTPQHEICTRLSLPTCHGGRRALEHRPSGTLRQMVVASEEGLRHYDPLWVVQTLNARWGRRGLSFHAVATAKEPVFLPVIPFPYPVCDTLASHGVIRIEWAKRDRWIWK